MVIAASVILLLSILLAPIFLIQFRKRWVAAAFKAMIMNMFVHSAHHRAQIEW